MKHPVLHRVGASMVGLAASILGMASPGTPGSDQGAPNVLFITIDDMNDWTTLFDPANPIRTPNLERLARRGTFFARGYCSSPACNPSRSATLSGVRPSTSGVYGNNSDWKKALSGIPILPQYFRDHGYHLGEKQHWEKFALYEKTNHIAYIIVAPGFREGQVSTRPVTLVDLYPTLVELCGLPDPGHLEGTSLKPLLENPRADWHPVLMTYERGNHAVRSDRYRYIRYAGGAEELYDTENDPHEWQNLANAPGSRAIMDDLAQWLPATNADPVGAAKNQHRRMAQPACTDWARFGQG